MPDKRERPWRGNAKAVDGGDSHRSDPTTTTDPDASEAASVVPVRDKLLWSWDDVAALTGLSRRLLEREVSAGRMPAPDIRVGRRACFRAATVVAWLDELAQPARGRGGRA